MASLLKVTCECDDGFNVKMAITNSTTCRDLANQLCQLRNTQDPSSCTFSPEDLSLVTTNELGGITCLLASDVSVKKTLDSRKSLKILGWQYRRHEWDEAIASGLEPPRKRPAYMPTATFATTTDTAEEDIEGMCADDDDDDDDEEGLNTGKRSSRVYKKPTTPSAEKSKTELRHLFVPDPTELEKLRSARVHKSEGTHDSEWDERFDLLLEFGRVRGNYNPAKSTICIMSNNTEIRLGKWVQRQRAAHKRGTLRADRLTRLQALVDEGKLVWSQETTSLNNRLSHLIKISSVPDIGLVLPLPETGLIITECGPVAVNGTSVPLQQMSAEVAVKPEDSVHVVKTEADSSDAPAVVTVISEV